MSDVFDMLGISKTTYEEADVQDTSKGYKPLESGVYDAKIKEISTFSTDSGAKMLKIVVTIPEFLDHEITQYQNIKKRDGTDNEIGVATLRHIAQAVNTPLSESNPVETEVEAYKKKVKGVTLKGLIGKPLKIMLREVKEPGAEFDHYNEIEGYLRPDGTNAKGEDIASKFKEKIEKNPVKTKKGSTQSDSSSGTTVTTASGKNLDELI